MNLTTYNRMLRYLAGEGDANLSDTSYNKRDIISQIHSVSTAIETYTNRNFSKTTYTQYFDVAYAQNLFFVSAPPITSITSVYIDCTGLFNGDESLLDSSEYFIDTNSNGVLILSDMNFISKRAVKITYAGGLSTTCANSEYVLSGVTGSGTAVGSYFIGSSSGAVGIVKSFSSPNITVEVLYGVFTVGESVVINTLEDGSDDDDYTATLQSKAVTALCESYPDIIAAAEIEIRYRKKHKHDYENISTTKESTSRQQLQYAADINSGLQPQTIALINPYKIYL